MDYTERNARLSETMRQRAIAKSKGITFDYKLFSVKQKQVLTWWLPGSPVGSKEGIIADGAIRAGKTVALSLSFGLWAMSSFTNQNFLICGKTIGSLRRNVVVDWKRQMAAQGYSVQDRLNDNMLTVRGADSTNFFHLFGGSDESSQDLVQGITAAGVLFDEVALMPRSFVDQAIGRCSIANSKYWFNCNPSHPKHWFKTEFIDKLKDSQEDSDAKEEVGEESPQKRTKDLIRLHFTMDDNLSLDEHIKERYRSMYSGVFYRRFILGQWCAADGLIYDSFDEPVHTYGDGDVRQTGSGKLMGEYRRYIAIDYGTTNPMSFLDIYDDGDIVRVHREYYYSSKEHGRQKTDREYADDFVKFAGNPDDIVYVILDPSAASFKAELRNRGFRIKNADNDVREGIAKVSTMFACGKLLIYKKCRYLINELLGYVWDEKAAQHGDERPVKTSDHACDALRYGIATAIYSKRRFV
jgi:PBSX family phage terminase large subunit